MGLRSTLASFVLLAVLAAPVPTGAGDPAEPTERQDGIAFTAWWYTLYEGRPAERAMANLADTGAGWVSILTTWYQDDIASTRLYPTDNTPTEDGLVHVIRSAHDLGLKVMLKPHVDLAHDPERWRGEIGDAWHGRPERWERWFRSYRRFVFRFAELAEAEGVEQFAIGCELEGTTDRARRWREIAAGVRDRFSGTLIYAANWGGEETGITWWDAVDLIGVDAYYPLTEVDDPTVEELEDAWAPHVRGLADLSSAWGDRKVILTEIGYRSVEGANRYPWDWQRHARLDLEEQADCYAATLSSVWDETWFGGMYWWDWSADPDDGGRRDHGYTPFGKPAEEILRAWY